MNDKVLKTLEYNKIIERLMGHAHSPMGKEQVQALLPSADIGEVSKRQKETGDGVRMSLRKGRIPLGGLKDIRMGLKRVQIGAVLSSTELLHVADVLRSAKRVRDYARDDRKEEVYPALDEIFEQVMTFPHIEGEINRCIIAPDEYADDATSALGNIRREIKSHNSRVREQLNGIIHSHHYQAMLQDPVITIRRDRYCVPVKAEYRSNFPGIIHDQSSTGATLFIEPMAVVETGNKINQLIIEEEREIEKILIALTGLVEDNLLELQVTLKALSLLDFIFAKAEMAIAMRATEPILNTKGYVDLKKARHPLLDPKSVVPIDVYLGDKFTTLLVTGPNTGGKTVTLKTLGLLSIMAGAGLQIPTSDGSEIAVFDEVFADIGDEQSIEQSLSTFSSHMTNIVRILDHVTLNSLVLFDELGAGTDPVEGAALAMAILEHLRAQEIRTAATTHYSELKLYALSTKGVENASCEFDVKSLSPTYKLLIGIPGKSNAFEISAKLGLPQFLVDEAGLFIEKENVKMEDIIIDLEESKNQAHVERQAAARYRQEARELKEKLEIQGERLEAQKEKILEAARDEAKKILEGAKAETDLIVKELKAAAREAQVVINERDIEGARGRLRDKIKSHDKSGKGSGKTKNTPKKPVENLQVGEEVLVLTFGQTGTVQKAPDHTGNALIQMGIMQMRVHISNIQRVKDASKDGEKKSKKAKVAGVSRNISKSSNISTEIDVRGQLGDDAIETVEKYLDDAYLSGLQTVTIIHGKGTGVLRTVIQQMLKRNPHVSSYRLGKYGEGEAGVTVVELK